MQWFFSAAGFALICFILNKGAVQAEGCQKASLFSFHYSSLEQLIQTQLKTDLIFPQPVKNNVVNLSFQFHEQSGTPSDLQNIFTESYWSKMLLGCIDFCEILCLMLVIKQADHFVWFYDYKWLNLNHTFCFEVDCKLKTLFPWNFVDFSLKLAKGKRPKNWSLKEKKILNRGKRAEKNQWEQNWTTVL